MPPEAPPLVLRQRPTRTNRTPEPIIIREAPPTPPPVPPKQIITIPGKTIRQPREIIYESGPNQCETPPPPPTPPLLSQPPPPPPPPPPLVCHESCLPCNYCYQNQNMFQETWHPYNNGSNLTYQNQNVFHESWVPYKSQNGGTVYAPGPSNQMVQQSAPPSAPPPPPPPQSWISYNTHQPIYNQNPYGYSNMPYNSSTPVYKYY